MVDAHGNMIENYATYDHSRSDHEWKSDEFGDSANANTQWSMGLLYPVR